MLGCIPGESGCICTAEDTCDQGLECSGNVCAAPTTGIQTLDYSYVCSDHLGFNTTSTRISGLENGRTYTFLVVAYDQAGNAVFGETIEARPIPTNGLWEQCEAQGSVCGEGWTCSVTDEPPKLGWLFAALGLVGLGGAVALRRRRRA
jgi:MYXO-CTERM domain-containing protein